MPVVNARLLRIDVPSRGVFWAAGDLPKAAVMAARRDGWLGPAFGLRLLLATVLQTVSGGHLCCSPRASDRNCAKEDGIFGPFWETQLKRVGSPSGCCCRRATWLYSAFDDYLSPPWVSSSSFF